MHAQARAHTLAHMRTGTLALRHTRVQPGRQGAGAATRDHRGLCYRFQRQPALAHFSLAASSEHPPSHPLQQAPPPPQLLLLLPPPLPPPPPPSWSAWTQQVQRGQQTHGQQSHQPRSPHSPRSHRCPQPPRPCRLRHSICHPSPLCLLHHREQRLPDYCRRPQGCPPCAASPSRDRGLVPRAQSQRRPCPP